MSKEPCCPSSAAEKNSCCPPTEKSSCTPPPAAQEDCCTTPDQDAACCTPKAALQERPGYILCDYVCGVTSTPAGEVPLVSSTLNRRDHLGHCAMRWGIGRDRYRVTPGLYGLGAPTPESPVVVTANYKMTFDLVRRDLKGLDAWLLVLDTKGINVWCAAGKGTFGSDELLSRIASSSLDKIVSHRKLLLPQYGAVGVAAHTVRKQSSFTVTYGPVRIADLPGFIAADNQATEGMRSTTFSFYERLVLTPVEFTTLWKEIAWALPVLLILGGIGPHIFSLTAAWQRGITAWFVGLLGVLCGAVLTPLLLPWLPGRSFAFKGALVGGAVGLVAALLKVESIGLLNSLSSILSVAALASFCAMNFTGSTPFTSPSGVEKEMRIAIPLQLAALLTAGVLWVWGAF